LQGHGIYPPPYEIRRSVLDRETMKEGHHRGHSNPTSLRKPR